ncbi:MAG: FAD-dependent oxidoreductase [Promethearchaeota archaeon]
MVTKEFVEEPARRTPVLKDADVLVVGGSQSGVAAAVSAKRAAPDLRVLLVEQNGYLGGQSVADMVVHWEFREYTNNQGVEIARGIGKEMIRRIVARGNSDPLYSAWLEGRGPPFRDWKDQRAVGDVPLDLEDIKVVLLEMCEEVGVEVLFLARAVAPLPLERTANGLPATRGVVVETPGGRFAVRAKVVVDCSANNDVAWWVAGFDAVAVPPKVVMNMQAYLWLGPVDCVKFVNAAWDEGSFATRTTYPDNREQMLEFVERNISITLRGGASYLAKVEEIWPDFYEEWEKTGALPPLYYWLKTIRVDRVGGCHLGTWAVEGPSFLWDQTDYFKVNEAHAKMLRACQLLLKIHRILPGWDQCRVVRTPATIGYRQTRVLKGVYMLTERDVRENATFPDAVGRASGHDVSRNKPGVEMGYQVPYRALLPAAVDGLVVGARSISCDPNDPSLTALNAQRGISATIITGQAAGVAAALSVAHGVEPRDVDVASLQDALRAQDVIW